MASATVDWMEVSQPPGAVAEILRRGGKRAERALGAALTAGAAGASGGLTYTPSVSSQASYVSAATVVPK
jgi:hypothetical protein